MKGSEEALERVFQQAALFFEGKALLSRSLAMERGIGPLDDARVKAQTVWREQC